MSKRNKGKIIKNIVLIYNTKQSEKFSIVSIRNVKNLKPKYYSTCAIAIKENKEYEELIPSTIEKLLFTKKYRFWKDLNKAVDNCFFNMSIATLLNAKECGFFTIDEMQSREKFLETILHNSERIEEGKIILRNDMFADIILSCKEGGQILISVPYKISRIARRVFFNYVYWEMTIPENREKEFYITKIKIYE